MAEPAPTTQTNVPSGAQGSPGQLEAARTNQPAQDARTASPAEGKGAQENAPTAEAVEQLKKALPSIAEGDRTLAQVVERVVRESADPLRANQRSFQHEVAYTVQDVELTKVGKLNLSEQARSEVTRLAESAPGLESVKMQTLLQSTATLEDRGLVRDIRNRSAEIGQRADQNTPAIRSQIEVLENRTRLAPKVDATADASAQPNRSPQPDASVQPDTRAGQQAPQSEPRRQQDAARQGQNERHFLADAVNSPMNGFFRSVRGNAQSTTPPWHPAPTPFGARLSAFEEKMQQGRDDITLRGIEKSGRAALEALEGFKSGEGAVMLSRIREAARSDPGGMAGVLSEMREGGKFADLRFQFNNALADEKGVSAAYDRAAAALARYGETRAGAEQIIARPPDATNLSAKFEAMDKAIGQAAGEMPSRRDGKAMLEDLSKQVVEMLQRAVDNVKSMFHRGPAQAAGPSGPSPG